MSNSIGNISIIISGLETMSDNIVGESTSFEMTTQIEDFEYYSENIDRYIDRNIKMFKMNRDNYSPIAKSLRLVEDICGQPVCIPESDGEGIFPYPGNRDVMIEVVFPVDDL